LRMSLVFNCSVEVETDVGGWVIVAGNGSPARFGLCRPAAKLLLLSFG